MTNVTRWDPFTDLRTTMDRLFDEGFSRPWRFLQSPELESSFPVEVSETDQEVEVKASLPGMKPEDVEITVQNDVLSIKAQHRETTEDRKRDYHRREIRYGSYHRAFQLPVSVDVDKAEAHFDNGMLTLKLPKAEAVKPRQIKIDGAKAIESGK
jgi:HSP20 family protein